MSTSSVGATTGSGLVGSDPQIDSSVGDDEFRAQVRAWIGSRKPEGLSQVADWSELVRVWWSMPEKITTPEYKEWEQIMLAERLVCGHWPARYGGRDLTEAQARIIDEECLRANVPRIFREQGESWVGPTILAHGTESQKDYFIPRIIDGTDRYCQGFSEPDHGSDLGALETRGVVTGDRIVIEGQKIWTTAAFYANQIFVLCRTDPAAESRYRGISFVIVDIPANVDKLDFRPIRLLSGVGEIASTFIDGATAPLEHVIGGLNNGWSVAMTTLDNERGGRAAASRNAILGRDFADLCALVRAEHRGGDPEVRRLLVDAYSKLQVLNRWATPGSGGVHESIEKIVSSEWLARFGELTLAVLGEKSVRRPASAMGEEDDGGYHLYPWQLHYFDSLAHAIASGSNEIQRNLIAERLLGLPREPRFK